MPAEPSVVTMGLLLTIWIVASGVLWGVAGWRHERSKARISELEFKLRIAERDVGFWRERCSAKIRDHVATMERLKTQREKLQSLLGEDEPEEE